MDDPYRRWRLTMFVLSLVFAVIAVVLVFVAGAVLGGSTQSNGLGAY